MNSQILDKVSQYNFFNYLYPGILFFIFSPNLYGLSLLNFLKDNTIAALFLAYLIGSVISRFGSLLIEPLLKRISFIKFVDHKDFVIAAERDSKINILSQENNTYRTLVALFLSLSVLHTFKNTSFDGLEVASIYTIFLVLLFLLFLFSYRKQTNYISRRVNNTRES